MYEGKARSLPQRCSTLPLSEAKLFIGLASIRLGYKGQLGANKQEQAYFTPSSITKIRASKH
jgi:hypothetical protein